MQKEVTTTITVDDIDRETEAVPTRFTFEGVGYLIDLCDANMTEMQAILDRYEEAKQAFREAEEQALFYVGHARQEPKPEEHKRAPRNGGRSKRKTVTPPAKVVREWALANGIEVPASGRMSKGVIQAYIDAHN